MMSSPYVIVGGKLETDGKSAKFSLSSDGKAWQHAGPDLDGFFPPSGPAHYEFRLRCELEAGAFLKSLKIVNDLQMAPLALPAVVEGMNNFVYSDQSPGGKLVRITHDWAERTKATTPRKSNAPLFPPNGGFSESTNIVFRWKAPPTPATETSVIDYQFELSDRADMLWPLSPNFYKLISKTTDKGKPQFTLPEGGLLSPGEHIIGASKQRTKPGCGVHGAMSGVSLLAALPRLPN